MRRFQIELLGEREQIDAVFPLKAFLAPMALGVMFAAKAYRECVTAFLSGAARARSVDMRNLDRLTVAAGNRAIMPSYPIPVRHTSSASFGLNIIDREARR